LTSIGKKVITTTTAAFDCQSKQEIVAVAGKRCGEARGRADQPARKCRANEGLHEVRAELRQGRQQLVQDQRGRRQQHARHVEADAGDFPQEHQREPEH
jgi:hypothetical protein